MSQADYRRRATVTDFESGKHEPDATTLALIAAALEKPINYFYPDYIKREFKAEKLTTQEQELLIQFNKIWNDKLQEVAINQVRALAEFDPVETLMEAIDFAQEQSKIRQDITEYFNKKKKRK